MTVKLSPVLGSAAVLVSGFACGQPSVTIYGQVDTAVRYTDNINGQDKNKLEMVSGGLSPSRLGFRGTEDLGGNLKAAFQLETGMALDSGRFSQQSTTGTNIFGRQATVGLSGDFGAVTLGRQTNALNVAFGVLPFGFIYWSDPVYFGGDNFFMGYRTNNSVVYRKTLGTLSVQLDYGMGEQTGSNRNGSTMGGSLLYANGALTAAGAFEQARARDGATTGKNGNIGMAYTIGNTRLVTGYLGTKETGATDRTRDMYYVGGGYQFTPAFNTSVGLYHYRQSDCTGVCVSTPASIGNVSGGMGSNASTGYSSGAGKGTANIIASVATYALSKRTTLYAEADLTLAKDGAARDDVNYWSKDVPGLASTRRLGVMTGIRHNF